jgi:hypothetical protein
MSTLVPKPNTEHQPSPFDNNHADPWAKTFIDLPELNASVTDAIASAITNVRASAREPSAELRTNSILVLGPAGAGKTHLFARLRKKLGPKAVFVHLRPLVGTEMTPRYVLGQIVTQLGYETLDPQGSLKQLGALVGSSLAHLEGASPDYPRMFLEEVEALTEDQRAEKVEWAVERLLERHQEADETYLTRLLTAPFAKPTVQRAALAWLSGRDLEESQLKRLGVTAGLAEERVIQALQTLGLFAAPGAPIVLVFDQLENLMDAESTGARVRAYANLVAELFDTTRGYVLVQMALDSEWEHAILPQLSAAQKTRLMGRSTVMALPQSREIRELVMKWVEHLPSRAEPFPWPFGEPRLDRWSKTPGMTPRMLMIECRQALALGPNAPLEPADEAPLTDRAPSRADGLDQDAALAAAWADHVSKARRALDEASADRRSADPARLIGGIACALRFVPSVQTSRADARQYVQLLARVAKEACAICFVHQSHPKAVSSALDRAAASLRQGRTVIVRERALDFPPTWKKVHAAAHAVIKQGAHWVTLERDDAVNMLALESFMAAAKSRDVEASDGRALETAEVEDWISRSLAIPQWPLSQALVTDVREIAPESDPGEPPRAKAHDDLLSTIRACLARLRVASLERLVREVSRVTPSSTRAEVVEALEREPRGIRWFGRSILAVTEEGFR